MRRAIRRLYESEMIAMEEHANGYTTVVLTKEGRKAAKRLYYNPDTMTISISQRWDQKWRFVVFDIPHHLKAVREAFRLHIRRLGLYPLQKSVYVYPHSCSDEIDFLVEFYGVRRYVRQITAEQVDNSLHLERVFRRSGIIR